MNGNPLQGNDEVVFLKVNVGHLARMLEFLAPGDDAVVQMKVSLCHAVVFGVTRSPWADVQVGTGTPLAAFCQPFTGLAVVNPAHFAVGLLPANLEVGSALAGGETKVVHLPFKALKAHLNGQAEDSCDIRFGGDGICNIRIDQDDVQIPLQEGSDPGDSDNETAFDAFEIINELMGRPIDISLEVGTQSLHSRLKRISESKVWLGVHAAERAEGKVAVLSLAESRVAVADSDPKFGTVLALAERLAEDTNITTLRRLQLTGAGPATNPATEAAAEAVSGIGGDSSIGPGEAQRRYMEEGGSGDDEVDVAMMQPLPATKRAKRRPTAAGTMVRELCSRALVVTERQAKATLDKCGTGDLSALRGYDVPCVMQANTAKPFANCYALYASVSLDMRCMMSLMQVAGRAAHTLGFIFTSNAVTVGCAVIVPLDSGCIMRVMTGAHAPKNAMDDDDDM
jgi:hypothetical protein